MTYLYEQLTPDRFQQFCQSILAAQFPNAQCLPVGQPDGGRDAYMWSMRAADERTEDLIVFQVKFSRDPTRADSDFLESIIASEFPKVERLKEKGLSAYYLLTNVSGSAHLDIGSVDKMNEVLKAHFDIPAFCWWRDDLDRRVDGHADIKWSYPEIIRGSDLLQALFEGALGEEQRRRDNALEAYLAAQYNDDREVKFKQVDLSHSLLDLFVDTSLQVIELDEKVHRFAIYNPDGKLVQMSAEEEDLAAQFFLQASAISPFLKSVLEGAPGQGKSTITQYICQIHRMRLLNKSLALVPMPHLEGLVRFPLRVDLRDFATWIGGNNPYAADPDATRPSDAQNSLESFLSFQISHFSGGHQFSVADLTMFAKASHVLIVLDGFDEVADIQTREQIVKEISKTSTRLAARSLQVVVTSRPAAFAKSPGFPRKDWSYLSLRSMEISQINEYAEKWMTARHSPAQERSEMLKVLRQKLDQPHMRDLARNPMQLAILLSLIQTRGLSLPDKRTALYDSYMELFFNREGEKSSVVREHRDLLITLHQYLAWMIQTEAEENNSKGSITEEKLKSLVHDYLARQGHRSSLVDDLFVGMVERVVALVSRVEGTFEFEVQPLREYFAARYLYETAPYSPPGSERRGTNPERFAVLSRNFYWLNVTRFFCGCYSRGELSSLAEGLIELAEAEDYRETSYPRLLTLMLLSDWVFAQQPLTIVNLVKMLLAEPGLKILLSSLRNERSTMLIAPERCGRNELVQGCIKVLSEAPKQDVFVAIAISMQSALPAPDLMRIWVSLKEPLPSQDWLRIGRIFGVLPSLDPHASKALVDELGQLAVSELALANCFDALELDQETFAGAIELALRGNGHFLHSRLGYREVVPYVAFFGFALDIGHYRGAFGNSPRFSRASGKGLPFKEAISYNHHLNPWRLDASSSTSLRGRIDADFLDRCDSFLVTFNKVADQRSKDWATTLAPWSELVDSGIHCFGEKPVFLDIALLAAGINSKNENGRIGDGLLDTNEPLCHRVRFARLKSGSTSWWETQFASANDELQSFFVLNVFLVWATPRTILSLAKLISPQVDNLSDSQWETLCARLERANKADRFVPEQSSIKDTFANCGLRLSIALALRLTPEVTSQLATIKLSNYTGTDRRILRFDLDRTLSALSDNSAKWHLMLPKIRRAYSHGVQASPQLRSAISHMRIPLPVARKICESADSYPLSLVEAAEAQLTKIAGSKAKPPGTVSRNEHWFS